MAGFGLYFELLVMNFEKSHFYIASKFSKIGGNKLDFVRTHKLVKRFKYYIIDDVSKMCRCL